MVKLEEQNCSILRFRFLTKNKLMGFQPRIQVLSSKRLVGTSIKMSLANNRTFELWSSVMPKLKKMGYQPSDDKYSLQVYPKSYFNNFNPQAEFMKWAAVEVANFSKIPEEMDTFTLNEGLYAIFDYKGPSNDNSIFQYIYTSWLPNSNYILDDRPHFEVLGKNYKNNDSESEEEIWIPIRPK